MATTSNQISTSNLRWIAGILSSEALQSVRNATVIARLCSTDFKNEVMNKGKTVDVATPKQRTARTKTIGTAATFDVAESIYQQISLDTHIYNAMIIEDVEQAWASGDLIEKYLPEMAYALAYKLDTAVVTKMQNAFSNIDGGVAATATMDKTDMIACGRKLKQLNASTNPRDLIGVLGAYSVSHAYEDNVSVLGANTMGDSGDSLVNATLNGANPLHGLTWYWSNNINTGTVTTTSPDITYEKNLIFDKKAVQLVHRPLPSTSAGSVVSVATDPNLGLSVRVKIQDDIDNIGQAVLMDMLYGIKAINYGNAESPKTYLGGIWRSATA